MIVKHLRQIQEQYGYLPVEELKALSARIGEPLHRLNEVITFFAPFRQTPPPPVEVKVCRDMVCHLRGAPACFETLEGVAREFGVAVPQDASLPEGQGESSNPGVGSDSIANRRKPRVHVEWVSCLGRCDQAPAALIELHNPGEPDQYRVLGTPAVADYSSRLRDVAGAHLIGDSPSPDPLDHAPLESQIDPYRASCADRFPPYEAVRRFAADLKNANDEAGRRSAGDGLIKTLSVSTLRGMGGAGVAVSRKWGDVRETPGDEKYIVCNADESEPTTFKDREILLRAPHLVIEGMVLAALLTGAHQGYVYIRHEYHDQIHAVEAEIARARAIGVLGPNVLGTRHSFELEVFESPGGYVCGEQSALIEAIEQRRAEPRNKPPQLETNGLYDKPTIVNNVESFAWAPVILLRGGEWYADQGTDGAKGLRLFSICGDVERPGVYEVSIGAPLRSLIAQAGGIAGGRALKAFAPSGPSGGLIPAEVGRQDVPEESRRNLPADGSPISVLDLSLDLDRFRTLGLMLGAGMMVVAEPNEGDPGAVGPVSLALNATRFFRNESCGKCVPCRIGSQKLVQIGEAIERARMAGDEQALARQRGMVVELRRAMELTSICGLGVVAAYPLATLFQSFWKDLGLQRPIADA